jgi:hypothetical protein
MDASTVEPGKHFFPKSGSGLASYLAQICTGAESHTSMFRFVT